MSGEDFGIISLADTTQEYVKTVKVGEPCCSKYDFSRQKKKTDEKEKKGSLLQRLPSFTSALRPNFSKVRHSLRRISCLKGDPEEEVPMMEIPRHRSIDIGVGLARRMSLFIFTKKSVCAHPYHPYVPKQTTRKIYICTDEK